MFKEFKDFAMRGTVVDLAVGIIIGGAFGTIVKSLVDDVIMPPVGLALGNVDFSDLFLLLKAGPKAAQDCGGETTTPETRTFDRDEAAYRRVRTFLERNLPSAVGPPILTKTCLYTLTPDRDFVVDRLPEAPGVVLGLGAAHGFKYASVLGRVLVELARDGVSPSARELDGFRVDRPILLEAAPATSWMV